jgi:hypothetical protein
MKFEPLPGFDWSRVIWSRPDSPRPVLCSYCSASIGEDDMPLMMWSPEGACAQFCDECSERWFGMRRIREVDE